MSNIHIEPTSAILRIYNEGSFKERSRFTFEANLLFKDEDTAIIKGGLSAKGKPLNKRVLKLVCEKLLELGYSKCQIERKGIWKEIDLKRAKQRLVELK